MYICIYMYIYITINPIPSEISSAGLIWPSSPASPPSSWSATIPPASDLRRSHGNIFTGKTNFFCWEKLGFPHFFVGKRIFFVGKNQGFPIFLLGNTFFLLEKPKKFPNKTSESRLIYPKPRSWAVLRNLAELLTHPRFGRITFPA